MSITSTILIATITISLPGTQHADLCDIVNPDTGTPVVCEPHRADAPVYDGDICCDADTCVAATNDGCIDGQSPYYCWLGEVLASNEFSCYFEVPDYCEVYPCAEPPGYSWTGEAGMLCCQYGICYEYLASIGDCPLGDIVWCSSEVCNDDGTVSCVDWE